VNENFINRYVNLYVLADDSDLINNHYDRSLSKCPQCHERGSGYSYIAGNEIVCRRCTQRMDVLDFIAWNHFVPRSHAVAWLNDFSESFK
jgi:hypothetical protein